ncbi:MAG: hypothetical protein LBK76_08295, partial [Verrucomicrobiales bacterium]|nr:hypothetical protein [Verrucomicrobiales bacterium]
MKHATDDGCGADRERRPACCEAPRVELPSAQLGKYLCPRCPDVVADAPGNCPRCRMALQRVGASLGMEREEAELRAMTWRFWVALALTLPMVALEMGGHFIDLNYEYDLEAMTVGWIELLLATPVVLWLAAPFFARGWRSLNMFTLI